MPKDKQSLHVYRNVLNVSDEQIERIKRLAEGKHIPLPDIPNPLRANILSPGEVLAFYRQIGTLPTADQLEELGNHIRNRISNSNKRFDVPTFPLMWHTNRRHSGRKVITMGTDNPRILRERRAAVSGLRSHIGVPRAKLRENDRFTHVYLAVARNDAAETKMQLFMDFINERPKLLPAALTFGRVQIDVIDYE